MRAQALGVHHLKARAGQVVQHRAHMQQLAAREDVLLDEVAHAGALLRVVHAPGGDAMVQHQPARAQQPRHGVEVTAHLCTPHVLEHAHRGDLVEGLVHVQLAIVRQLHAHPSPLALARG